MVEKVKFINITGSAERLAAATEELLPRYEIQLEQATKELSDKRGLRPLSLDNPYTEPLSKVEHMAKSFGEVTGPLVHMPKDEALDLVERARNFYNNTGAAIKSYEEKLAVYESAMNALEPFTGLDFRLEALASFEYLDYHFGRLPASILAQTQDYIYSMADILFVPAKEKDGWVYGVYFSTKQSSERVNAIFSSMHFENVELPGQLDGQNVSGSPKDVYAKASMEAARVSDLLSVEEKMMNEHLEHDRSTFTRSGLLRARQSLRELKASWETRRFGAVTPDGFFIFLGWIGSGELESFRKDAVAMGLTVIAADDNEGILAIPPVKLKNPKIFSPFEFFTSMYGLPSYGEMDPTPFLAVTYTILFGLMFADIGQGLVIFLAGIFLSKGKKPMQLGPVFRIIGVASMIFGTIFGSIFGFEADFALYHPADPANTTNTLLYAIGLGIGLILISMTLNLVNAHKRKRWREAIFSPNGVAGAVFYIAVLVYVLLMLLGIPAPGWYIPVMAIIPLASMGFREQLSELLAKKKPKVHGIGMFLFEAVIGMFETALSFFTNTVSYVRVGAFALSHACIMSVVWLLSRGASGASNPVVIIFGNILVMALEGLIVGIQVLRLEFYEMFSRFYEGGGRKFQKNSI